MNPLPLTLTMGARPGSLIETEGGCVVTTHPADIGVGEGRHSHSAGEPLTDESRWDAVMRAVGAMARAYAVGDIARARRHLEQAAQLMEGGAD